VAGAVVDRRQDETSRRTNLAWRCCRTMKRRLHVPTFFIVGVLLWVIAHLLLFYHWHEQEAKLKVAKDGNETVGHGDDRVGSINTKGGAKMEGQSDKRWEVVLCYHSSADEGRLESIGWAAKRWEGPIGVVVYTNSEQEDKGVEEWASNFSNLFITLQRRRNDDPIYPVNRVRNAALVHCQSLSGMRMPYSNKNGNIVSAADIFLLLLLDADFIPSADLYHTLVASRKWMEERCEQRAFVVAPFSLTNPDIPENEIPATQDDLKYEKAITRTTCIRHRVFAILLSYCLLLIAFISLYISTSSSICLRAQNASFYVFERHLISSSPYLPAQQLQTLYKSFFIYSKYCVTPNRQAMMKEKAELMNPSLPAAHVWGTDYPKWWKADYIYPVPFRYPFEPYVALCTPPPPYPLPFRMFDATFVHYGGDKSSFSLQLDRDGYQFEVIPREYIVHRKHEIADWATKPNSDPLVAASIVYVYESDSLFLLRPPRHPSATEVTCF